MAKHTPTLYDQYASKWPTCEYQKRSRPTKGESCTLTLIETLFNQQHHTKRLAKEPNAEHQLAVKSNWVAGMQWQVISWKVRIGAEYPQTCNILCGILNDSGGALVSASLILSQKKVDVAERVLLTPWTSYCSSI